MGCKDSGEISIAKCSSTPGTDTPPPPTTCAAAATAPHFLAPHSLHPDLMVPSFLALCFKKNSDPVHDFCVTV